MKLRHRLALSTTVVLCAVNALSAQAASGPDPRAGESNFRALYKELVETDSSWPNGSCTLAAERMGARLKAAGYPDGDIAVIVDPAYPKEGNLSVILPGSNK